MSNNTATKLVKEILSNLVSVSKGFETKNAAIIAAGTTPDKLRDLIEEAVFRENGGAKLDIDGVTAMILRSNSDSDFTFAVTDGPKVVSSVDLDVKQFTDEIDEGGYVAVVVRQLYAAPGEREPLYSVTPFRVDGNGGVTSQSNFSPEPGSVNQTWTPLEALISTHTRPTVVKDILDNLSMLPSNFNPRRIVLVSASVDKVNLIDTIASIIGGEGGTSTRHLGSDVTSISMSEDSDEDFKLTIKRGEHSIKVFPIVIKQFNDATEAGDFSPLTVCFNQTQSGEFTYKVSQFGAYSTADHNKQNWGDLWRVVSNTHTPGVFTVFHKGDLSGVYDMDVVGKLVKTHSTGRGEPVTFSEMINGHINKTILDRREQKERYLNGSAEIKQPKGWPGNQNGDYGTMATPENMYSPSRTAMMDAQFGSWARGNGIHHGRNSTVPRGTANNTSWQFPPTSHAHNSPNLSDHGPYNADPRSAKEIQRDTHSELKGIHELIKDGAEFDRKGAAAIHEAFDVYVNSIDKVIHSLYGDAISEKVRDIKRKMIAEWCIENSFCKELVEEVGKL